MTKQTKLKLRELKDGDKISVIAMTEKYGVADFAVCPVYKFGVLKKMYLYPRQQEATEYFVYSMRKYKPLDFSILSNGSLEAPSIRVYFWCKEHKCASFIVYVPRNATHFIVRALSNFSINFGRD